MDLMAVRRGLMNMRPSSFGGLPVYAYNACFNYRNGLATDYFTDNDFFIAGPFDTGGSESKTYLVSRFPETASGNVTPCFRPYNDLTGTSLDFYAIGSSNAMSRAVVTGGRYVLTSLAKNRASTAYMYDQTNGRYIYLGNGVKTYGGLPVYIDNAYYANKNGYATDVIEDDRYFIAGPFDSLNTGSGKIQITFNRYSGGVGTTGLRAYTNLTSNSADFWSIGGSGETRTVNTPGQYYLVPILKEAAANMFMYKTSNGLYLYKGNNVT